MLKPQLQLIVLNFIPDRRSSKNCIGTVSFFKVCEPLATSTHKVIEHGVGRDRGHKKLRVTMENKFEHWCSQLSGGLHLDNCLLPGTSRGLSRKYDLASPGLCIGCVGGSG